MVNINSYFLPLFFSILTHQLANITTSIKSPILICSKSPLFLLLSSSFQFYFIHLILERDFLLYCEKIVVSASNCKSTLWHSCGVLLPNSNTCTNLILRHGKNWVCSWTRKKSGVVVWFWSVERVKKVVYSNSQEALEEWSRSSLTEPL